MSARPRSRLMSLFRKAVLGLVGFGAIFGTGQFMERQQNADSAIAVEMNAHIDASRTLADNADPALSPYLLLGDTNHDDMRIMEFLAREGTMQSLAQKGYKNLFLEERVEFQGIADQVAQGKMTPDQYAAAKAEAYRKAGEELGESDRSIMMARVIQAAAKSGLNIVFVEHQMPDLKSHAQMVDNLDATRDAFDAQLGTDAALNSGAKQFAARYFTGEVQQARSHLSAFADGTSYDWSAHKAWRDALAARIMGDKTLSETILDKSQGKPSIIIYGAGHGRFVQDLDEFLHAQRIELFPDGLSARVAWEYMHASGEHKADALIISSGTFIRNAESDRFTEGAPQTPENKRVDDALLRLQQQAAPKPPSS